MRLPHFATVSLTAACLMFTGYARAQQKEKPIEYEFMDDSMLGTTLSANLAILKVRPRPPRVTLIRPRASFVAELFDSCEKL